VFFTKINPENQLCYQEMQLTQLGKCSSYSILSMQLISIFFTDYKQIHLTWY